MTGTLDRQFSAWAAWARRIALLSVQLIVFAIILHRFAGLPTPIMLNALGAGFAAILGALVLAIIGFVDIWRTGHAGAGASVLAIVIGMAALAWPLAYLPNAISLPAITDVTTDPVSPPAFIALAKLREPGANAASYPGASAATLQAAGYPDLKPMLVARPLTESFDLTREIIRRMNWTLVAERAPKPATGPGGRPTGEIEAEARTPIMGFRDDVIVRFTGEQDKTRIDIRSASRYGKTDLGRNAQRVRLLMAELHTRLDLGIPLEPEGGRRRKFKSKLLQGRNQGAVAQGSEPDSSPQDAQRERTRKLSQRSRDEGRARDKRRQRSEE